MYPGDVNDDEIVSEGTTRVTAYVIGIVTELYPQPQRLDAKALEEALISPKLVRQLVCGRYSLSLTRRTNSRCNG